MKTSAAAISRQVKNKEIKRMTSSSKLLFAASFFGSLALASIWVGGYSRSLNNWMEFPAWATSVILFIGTISCFVARSDVKPASICTPSETNTASEPEPIY